GGGRRRSGRRVGSAGRRGRRAPSRCARRRRGADRVLSGTPRELQEAGDRTLLPGVAEEPDGQDPAPRHSRRARRQIVTRENGLAIVPVAAASLDARTARTLADACAEADGDAAVRVVLVVAAQGLPDAVAARDEVEHAAIADAVATLAAVRKPTIAAL